MSDIHDGGRISAPSSRTRSATPITSSIITHDRGGGGGGGGGGSGGGGGRGGGSDDGDETEGESIEDARNETETDP